MDEHYKHTRLSKWSFRIAGAVLVATGVASLSVGAPLPWWVNWGDGIVMAAFVVIASVEIARQVRFYNKKVKPPGANRDAPSESN